MPDYGRETVLPSAIAARFRRVVVSAVSRMKMTAPSAIRKLAPPECRLPGFHHSEAWPRGSGLPALAPVQEGYTQTLMPSFGSRPVITQPRYAQAARDLDRARAGYEDALARATELGMRPLEAHAHLGLAGVTTGEAALQHRHLAAATYRALGMRLWRDRAAEMVR